jgi:hypothetical protein
MNGPGSMSEMNSAINNWVSLRLRTAVHSVPAPTYMETRIRARMRESEHDVRRRSWFVAVAATAAICIGVTVAYQLGHLRLTANSQESFVTSMSNQVATIMRVGLRDHIHCAVFRTYPKTPPKLEDLAQRMGPKYAGLVQVVNESFLKGYELMLAHQCRYHGRKFVHLALANGGKLLSLVVAVKAEGESFQTENLVPALSEAGIPIYRTGVQRFQVAAFETRGHLVYVISDQPQQKNMTMLLALVPSVQKFLKQLES